MTDKALKIGALLGAVSFVVVSVVAGVLMFNQVNKAQGAPGGLLIENYLPFIMYNDGYKSEKGITLSGANGDITTGDDLTVGDDATVSGGTFTVTTSNSATSSAVLGCVQRYATSTETPWRTGILPVGTTSLAQNGVAPDGFVIAEYGSCPF